MGSLDEQVSEVLCSSTSLQECMFHMWGEVIKKEQKAKMKKKRRDAKTVLESTKQVRIYKRRGENSRRLYK